MAFSQDTKDRAYRRAGGRCECEMTSCGHRGRCNQPLGSNWHAHHRKAVASGGNDTLGNCLAMCISRHENTRTYGRRI